MKKENVIDILKIKHRGLSREYAEYDRLLNLDGCTEIDRAHYIGLKRGLYLGIYNLECAILEITGEPE